MIREEKRKISINELKSLMIGGKLPEEYVNEENILALLVYEIERMRVVSLEYDTKQMQKSELCDLSIIIYCIDVLVRKYSGGGNVVNKWEIELSKIKESLQNIDRNSEEAASEFIKRMFEALKPQMSADEKLLRKSAEKFGNLLKESEKRERQRKVRLTLRKHVVAFMIACVFMLPVALIALNTNLFGDIADFTRGMFQSIRGNEVYENDMARAGFDAGVYSSIGEFEAARGVNLMVPRWLPRGLEVDELEYFNGMLRIRHTDEIALLLVNFNTNIPLDIGDAKIYEHNGIMFYVFEDSNVIWWEYNGDFYHFDFGFDITEHVYSVIENIK